MTIDLEVVAAVLLVLGDAPASLGDDAPSWADAPRTERAERAARALARLAAEHAAATRAS